MYTMQIFEEKSNKKGNGQKKTVLQKLDYSNGEK